MTVFEKILSGEIPCQKVYEDEEILAFHDIEPQAPIHVLIIPKKKACNYSDLEQWSDNDCGKLFKAAVRVINTLGLKEKGYRLITNSGSDGGQTVDYFHLHLLAGKKLGWPNI